MSLWSPQFPSYESPSVVRFPNPLATGSDIHPVGKPDHLFCIFYHLFSCRGSYLGSPCLSSLGWASPAYLRGFLFSCRPFCLWFWSFHNMNCLSELLQSPAGHLNVSTIATISFIWLPFCCQVPQHTCYWKWHSWQFGKLTTSSVSFIIRWSYLGTPQASAL